MQVVNQPRASPRHAQADIAFDGIARLTADRSQIAGIGVNADVAGQLAGDATAALNRRAAVAPRRDGIGPEGDGSKPFEPHQTLPLR